MKKVWKVIGIMFVLVLLILHPGHAEASDNEIARNTLLEISQEAEVYEQENGQGKVLMTLDVGTPVISAEDINVSGEGDSWCLISYQDVTGYIQLKQLKQYAAEDIAKEYESISNTNKLVFEEVEYNKTQKKQKIIWGCIIAGLVIAIFAVGIVSAVRTNTSRGTKRKHSGKGRRRRGEA